jgi:hypothetical protein
MSRTIVGILLATLMAIYPLYFNTTLLTKPENAPLPREERQGYFEDWTAGQGLKEIADYLKTEAAKGPIVIGTNGGFGTLPDGLYIYLDKTPNISLTGGKVDLVQKLSQEADKHPTFFVSSKSQLGIPPKELELIKWYPKAMFPGKEQDQMMLFKVHVSKPL